MLFFSDTTGVPFVVFGPLHFFLLSFVLCGILLIYFFRKPLRKFKYNNQLRYIFAGILFTNMTVYYISLAMMGYYDVRKHLPLEFCFITGYLFMYILVTQNRKLYRVIYFFTIMGPLPAMLWPNLSGSYDRFIFYQFFISHHLMMLMSFYTLIVFQYRVEPKDAVRAFGWAVVLFGSVYGINVIFGTNYIMQSKLPDTVLNLYPFLRSFNVPIFWLILCGGACLLLALGVALLLQDKTGKEQVLTQHYDREAGTIDGAHGANLS
jgi:hypothetical integral membrane protein (TIGR02206 family)